MTFNFHSFADCVYSSIGGKVTNRIHLNWSPPVNIMKWNYWLISWRGLVMLLVPATTWLPMLLALSRILCACVVRLQLFRNNSVVSKSTKSWASVNI